MAMVESSTQLGPQFQDLATGSTQNAIRNLSCAVTCVTLVPSDGHTRHNTKTDPPLGAQVCRTRAEL
jgi:hypothetical protein